MKINLTNEDISTLKKARADNLGLYALVVFACLGFFFVGVSGSKDPEFWGTETPWWTPYLFYTLPSLLMLNTIKDIFNYQLDIIRGYKLVMTTKCRKYTQSGEGVSHHLLIEDYGEIHLFGYNEKCYLNSFYEQDKRYEIHLAPLSKVLLSVRYIHVAEDRDILNS